MDAADLAFAGPSRQAELVRSGEVSARELTELYLERIERLDPEINAYRTVMAERALIEADQADQRRKAGDDRPLLGVPLAVKDNVDVAGELTTHGTSAHDGRPATEDAELVRRLRGAGAVIIGKTNMPELAIIGDTESPTFGVTRNRGTWNAQWADPAAAARRRWQPASQRRPTQPTARVRSAYRPPTADCSG